MKMTPDNYTGVLKQIMFRLDAIDERQSRIERMVTAIYNDEEPAPIKTNSFKTNPLKSDKPREMMTADEEVYNYGQKIPYNLLWDTPDVDAFQQFLYDAKTKHRHKLTDMELEMVDYADKGFEDVRLSVRHLATMKRVYYKVTNTAWPFKTKSGYMYKLEGFQPVWEWIE
jgi:hypothetical protein